MLSKILILRNEHRKKLMLKKYQSNLDIHESAILMDNFNISFYVKPENRKYIEIGQESMINNTIIFESKTGAVTIGDHTYIGGGSIVSKSSINIGNDVTIAWGVMLYDHDSHSIQWEHRKNDNRNVYNEIKKGTFIENKQWNYVKTAPITIEDKVWIGFDAVILKGVTIGEGAVVAARSVVTQNVPPYTVVAGNPAQVVKYINE